MYHSLSFDIRTIIHLPSIIQLKESEKKNFKKWKILVIIPVINFVIINYNLCSRWNIVMRLKFNLLNLNVILYYCQYYLLLTIILFITRGIIIYCFRIFYKSISLWLFIAYCYLLYIYWTFIDNFRSVSYLTLVHIVIWRNYKNKSFGDGFTYFCRNKFP